MAKKKRATKTAKANPTAPQIMVMWRKANRAGMGGKHLQQTIVTEFERRLLKAIQKQLNAGNNFRKAKKGTLIVARDIGRVCALLTHGSTVTKPIFVQVFKLVRHNHPACPLHAGGGGAWCDEGA